MTEFEKPKNLEKCACGEPVFTDGLCEFCYTEKMENSGMIAGTEKIFKSPHGNAPEKPKSKGDEVQRQKPDLAA